MQMNEQDSPSQPSGEDGVLRNDMQRDDENDKNEEEEHKPLQNEVVSTEVLPGRINQDEIEKKKVKLINYSLDAERWRVKFVSFLLVVLD